MFWNTQKPAKIEVFVIDKINFKILKKSVDKYISLWYYIWAVERTNKTRKQNKAKFAGVAQLVEQLICNQQVGGSSPSTSSKKPTV